MMRELIDNELDLVGGGSNQGQNGRGLVVVGAQIGDITVTDVLSHNAVLNNSLNGNTVQVPIGVAVAVCPVPRESFSTSGSKKSRFYRSVEVSTDRTPLLR